MEEKGPPAPKIPPTPKATRSKATDQAKGRAIQRNPPKQNPSNQDPPLELQVVVVPADQPQGQDPPNDTNPPPHIPKPPPPPNLPAHLQNLPNQPSNPLPNPEEPQGPPAHAPNPPPQAPMQPPNPPANPPNPMQPQAPPAQMPQLSWSYLKPEISGKPEEDVIPHLLRTNNWMDMHNFPEEAKVQRFCFNSLQVRLDCGMKL